MTNNEQGLHLPPLPYAEFRHQGPFAPGQKNPPEVLEMRGGDQIISGKKGHGKKTEKHLGQVPGRGHSWDGPFHIGSDEEREQSKAVKEDHNSCFYEIGLI